MSVILICDVIKRRVPLATTALVMKMPNVTMYATILAIFEKALTVAALANEPEVSFGGLVRNRSHAFLSSSLMMTIVRLLEEKLCWI